MQVKPTRVLPSFSPVCVQPVYATLTRLSTLKLEEMNLQKGFMAGENDVRQTVVEKRKKINIKQRKKSVPAANSCQKLSINFILTLS